MMGELVLDGLMKEKTLWFKKSAQSVFFEFKKFAGKQKKL